MTIYWLTVLKKSDSRPASLQMLFFKYTNTHACKAMQQTIFESLAFEVGNIYIFLKEISPPLEMLCVSFTTVVLFT